MTLSVVFRRAAVVEFEDAASWYESERYGLGEEFLAEVNTAITKAVADPGLYQFRYGDVRGVAARRFPYVVYFRVRDDKLVVLAIFHSSRDPAIWQGVYDNTLGQTLAKPHEPWRCREPSDLASAAQLNR